ncbi:reverse transcriptase domain-containing protein [Tanacetum coccineum]
MVRQAQHQTEVCIRQTPPNQWVGRKIKLKFREGIKARLDQVSKNWVEEVPHVLWVHRTMIKTSNGETPFSLTYDTKAVIPVEIGMPSLRYAEVDQVQNDEALILNLDMLEEKHEIAAIREAKSKARMENTTTPRSEYNLQARNFVYKRNEAIHAKEGGKLGSKWEGSYEVVEALGKGAYRIKNGSGDILSRTWNVQDLKNVTFNFSYVSIPNLISRGNTLPTVGEIFT